MLNVLTVIYISATFEYVTMQPDNQLMLKYLVVLETTSVIFTLGNNIFLPSVNAREDVCREQFLSVAGEI